MIQNPGCFLLKINKMHFGRINAGFFSLSKEKQCQLVNITQVRLTNASHMMHFLLPHMKFLPQGIND